ncbi:MAG: zinc ribbon domain-containing protein [Lachnospiraceae bacterium]|nr:zinc ribbon domain-containing protein [Lachnospiraceae bacterium]
MNEQKIIIAISLTVIVMITLMIGIFVYQDAKKKQMNAVMWTAVTLLCPVLIGFIFYLLVRSSYLDMKCPQCGSDVKEEYVLCPRCGTKLKALCLTCSRPVEEDWLVCPWCASSLETAFTGIVKPLRKKEKLLRKILIAVIVIPTLLLTAVIGYVQVRQAEQKPSQIVNSSGLIFADAYFRANPDRDILAWYEHASQNQEKAYALKYQRMVEGMNQTCILVYIPKLGVDDILKTEREFDGVEATITLTVDSSGRDIAADAFQKFIITNEYYFVDHLEVYYDGVEMECEVTLVDSDPVTVIREYYREHCGE